MKVVLKALTNTQARILAHLYKNCKCGEVSYSRGEVDTIVGPIDNNYILKASEALMISEKTLRNSLTYLKKHKYLRRVENKKYVVPSSRVYYFNGTLIGIRTSITIKDE